MTSMYMGVCDMMQTQLIPATTATGQSISDEKGFKGEHLVQVSLVAMVSFMPHLIPSLCLLHEVITGDIIPFFLIYIVFLSGFSAGAPGWLKLTKEIQLRHTVYI